MQPLILSAAQFSKSVDSDFCSVLLQLYIHMLFIYDLGLGPFKVLLKKMCCAVILKH